MPVAIDRQQAQSLIRVEGEFSVTSAAELRKLLKEALGSGKKIQIDLGGAAEIDVSLLQLIWSAEHDPAWAELGRVSGVSEAASRAARDAGFERFPGTGDGGVSRE